MFGIHLKRELSRRKKAVLVVAMGLALGIALVITVDSVSAGMTQAQDKVLRQVRQARGRQELKRTRRQALPRAALLRRSGRGARSRHACPVSKREIRPSSSTMNVHLVRISPQVSLR